MSTGALTQLAAIGSQDQYLNVGGSVTFWKGQYDRHSNFAMDTVPMSFHQTPAWGQRVTAVISRTGDLLSKSWLVVTIPALNTGTIRNARYCDEVGYALIDSVELIIGGTVIDRHFGTYMQAWTELSERETERKSLQPLVGGSYAEQELENWAKKPQTLYIPLQFFFCRHLVQALPLISLQYHEVKLEVKFNEFKDCIAKTGVRVADDLTQTSVPIGDYDAQSTQYQLKDGHLLCNMVYLEEEERKQFASNPHEYLVDLVQHPGDVEITGTSTNYTPFFNHPASEFIFTLTPNASLINGEPFNHYVYDDVNVDGTDDQMDHEGMRTDAVQPLIDARIQFNGYDRVQKMKADYFRTLIPAQVHSSVPSRPVYVYSFALDPEDYRPTGSANLSRIDNVKLILTHEDMDDRHWSNDMLRSPVINTAGELVTSTETTSYSGGKLRLFCRSKNILRFRGGMAGLAYAS